MNAISIVVIFIGIKLGGYSANIDSSLLGPGNLDIGVLAKRTAPAGMRLQPAGRKVSAQL